MSKPVIDYRTFRNKSREEILEVLLKYITVYEEESHLEEFKTKTWHPHLKVFIVRTYEFSPLSISERLKRYYYDKIKDKKFMDFMNIFTILVVDLFSNNFYLKMENLETKEKFHFIIFSERNYWTIITLTKKEHLKRTILKIVNSIPELEIIKITSRHLENLIHEQGYENNIKGFIAKYKPYQSERNITVDVYGGDLNDLNKIREIFFVEPTSFVYSLRNSPIGLVEGKIFFDGNFTLERIIEGNTQLAIETIKNLSNSYEKINDFFYERVELYDNAPTLINSGKGLILKSRYIIVIKIKENRIKRTEEDTFNIDKITYEDLNKKIVNYFKNRPQRYLVYSDRPFSHFICDKATRNKVQLTIESKFNNIIIYPLKNCKGMTLRDICNGVMKVESSIEAFEPYCYSN